MENSCVSLVNQLVIPRPRHRRWWGLFLSNSFKIWLDFWSKSSNHLIVFFGINDKVVINFDVVAHLFLWNSDTETVSPPIAVILKHWGTSGSGIGSGIGSGFGSGFRYLGLGIWVFGYGFLGRHFWNLGIWVFRFRCLGIWVKMCIFVSKFIFSAF